MKDTSVYSSFRMDMSGSSPVRRMYRLRKRAYFLSISLLWYSFEDTDWRNRSNSLNAFLISRVRLLNSSSELVFSVQRFFMISYPLLAS